MDFYRESNRAKLRQALRSLPTYQPPAELWTRIEAQLTQQQEWQARLRELPSHRPPDGIWEAIEHQLHRPEPRIERILRLGRRFWPAAAIITGLCCCIWWLTKEPYPKISLRVGTEWHTAPEIPAEDDNVDMTFATLLAEAQQSPVSESALVQRLQREYEELSQAQEEVRTMLQRYGKAADLLKTWARLERERSQVIKQLAQLI